MTPSQILGAFSIAAMLVTLARDVRNARTKEGVRWKTSAFIAVLLLVINGGGELLKRRADAKSAERQTQRDEEERQFRLDLVTSVATVQSTLNEQFRQHEPELKNLPPAASAEIRYRYQELQKRLADLAHQIEAIGANGAASSGEIRALVTEIGGSVQQFNVALQYVSTIRPVPRRARPDLPRNVVAPPSGGFAVIGTTPPSPLVPETKPVAPPLVITVPTPPPQRDAFPASGVWVGSIVFDQGAVPVIVTIDTSGNSGRFESRDLGLSQAPININFRAGSLSFDLPSVDLSVDATLASNNVEFDGTVSRLDFEAPIHLTRQLSSPRASEVDDNRFSPSIQGLRVFCTTTYGATVPSMIDLRTSGLGAIRTSPIGIIDINPVALSKLSRGAQLLWYGHQCAHFRLPANAMSELLADCWAVVIGERQNLFAPGEFMGVVGELSRLDQTLPNFAHLPTGTRALTLPGCFKYSSLFN